MAEWEHEGCSNSVCGTDRLGTAKQGLKETDSDNFRDRVLQVIVSRDVDSLRDVLRSSPDRRVPHAALVQVLLLKDEPTSTDLLKVLLHHHGGADLVQEPVRLTGNSPDDYPPVLRRQVLSMTWDEAEEFGCYQLYPVHVAACQGRVEACRMLCAAGAHPGSLDCRGTTTLALAAACGDVHTLSFFMSRGLSASEADNHGNTALHHAASLGNHQVLDPLLDSGAPWLAANREGMWPLLVAAENCHASCVEALAKRATVRQLNTAQSVTGRTALHYAALAGDVTCVNTLLRYGVNVQATTSEGDTALHLAKTSAVVEALTSEGEELLERKNDAGMTPLVTAVASANSCVTNSLLRGGADPDTRDKWGRTPLHHLAASLPCTCLGASTIVDREARTCCHKLTCMRLLLEAGAHIDAADNKGGTPLHHALRHNRLDSARILLRRGALPAPRDASDRTPLGVANQQHVLSCVLAFIQAGVRPDSVRADVERIKQRVVRLGEAPFINALLLMREAGWVGGRELNELFHSGSPNSQWRRVREVLPPTLDLSSLSRAHASSRENSPLRSSSSSSSSSSSCFKSLTQTSQLPGKLRRFLSFEDYTTLIVGDHFTFWGFLEGKTRPRRVDMDRIVAIFSRPRPAPLVPVE